MSYELDRFRKEICVHNKIRNSAEYAVTGADT
jgi:hypothetical protein